MEIIKRKIIMESFFFLYYKRAKGTLGSRQGGVKGTLMLGYFFFFLLILQPGWLLSIHHRNYSLKICFLYEFIESTFFWRYENKSESATKKTGSASARNFIVNNRWKNKERIIPKRKFGHFRHTPFWKKKKKHRRWDHLGAIVSRQN